DAITYRFRGVYTGAGAGVDIPVTNLRLRDDTGRPLGWAAINKPAVGMAALTRMAAMGDLRHFERMQKVAKAGRRPAAILFADLESSSPLARRLRTPGPRTRSEEHTSELQSLAYLVCRLLLEKKNITYT